MARIQISNDPSGRIIVSFPYDPLLVEKAKSIDGRIKKVWCQATETRYFAIKGLDVTRIDRRADEYRITVA